MPIREIGVVFTADLRPLSTGVKQATAELGGYGKAVAGMQKTIDKAAAGGGTGARKTADTVRKANRDVETSYRSVDSTVGKFTRGILSSQGQIERQMSLAAKGAAGFGIAFGLGVAGATVEAARFDQEMRNVQSITQQTDAELAANGNTILAMSTNLRAGAQDADTLAKGLYEISSSGFQGAAGLQVLEASARAASAGMTTTDVAAKAIDAALNSYNLSAASANDVSDTLFKTVDVGVISFEELAQNMGDFVGSAAAAHVPLEDASAALAAMTLNGIPAAEAATALNGLLEKLVNPSEKLAVVYKQLGYESGESALQQKGLAGVIDDIRVASGGSLQNLVQWIPEIRAARGALALMNNEGATYQRVQDQMADKTDRLGATQRALDTQMKATAAQWTRYKNVAHVAAIEAGALILPVFNALMDGAADLGQDGLPLVMAGFEHLQPILSSAHDVGLDVWTVITALVDQAQAFGPAWTVAGAALAGGVGALQLTASTIAAVTGFIADHEHAVLALALLYGTRLGLPAVISLFQFLRTTLLVNATAIAAVTAAEYAQIGGAAGAAAATRAFAASLLSLQTVATVGIAAALYIGIDAFNNWREAQEKAKESTDKIRSSFDAYNTTKATEQLDELREKALESMKAGEDLGGVWGTFRAGWDSTMFGSGELGKAAAEGKAAADAYNDLSAQMEAVTQNSRSVSAATGLTTEAIKKLAQEQGIDLTKPFEDSADVRQKLISYTRDLEQQTKLSADSMASAVGMDVDAMQALADAIQSAQDKASQAFMGDVDVVANFDPAKALEAQQSQAEKVQKANQKLSDTQDRLNGKTKITVSQSQQLRKAQEAVAEAQAKVGSGAAAGATTLEGYYTAVIKQADTYTAQLQSATEKGLDPGVVTRLLQAGPEKAAPVLEALAKDHSGRLIDLVNTSEQKLAEINQKVVEMARLTAVAVNSTTDQAGRDLRTAMAISQAVIASEGKATAEQIAAQLKAPSDEVLRIAKEFGITLGGQVAAGMASVKLNPSIVGGQKQRSAQDQKDALADRRGYAWGGLVSGPGGPRDDLIPAWLSNREYVQPAHVVAHYGVEFMDALRRRQIPRFADGGLVGAWAGAVGGRVAPTPGVQVVRVVEQHITSTTHHDPIHVGQVVTRDATSFKASRPRRGFSPHGVN